MTKVREYYNNSLLPLKAGKENAPRTAEIIDTLMMNRDISVQDALNILDDAKTLLPRVITLNPLTL